jgi:hypothetical protein
MTAASYPLTLIASMLAITRALDAQVPGAPVLQNGFVNPGLAVAGNIAGGSGQSFYGAAVAWGLAGGRFQVSGAAGAQRINDATRGAYGGRLAANVWSSRGGSLGAGAFAGVGGAPRTGSGNTVTNGAVLMVPGGVTIGYRRLLGTKRGISAYASPMYNWIRTDDGNVVSGGSFAVSGGVDFAVTQSLGVTVGGDWRQKQSGERSGGSTFGAAATFVPGRR